MRQAFTIVELLIVIVVIAILATISIVAYTGIQQHAKDSRTTLMIDNYSKGLQLYALQNGGVYPGNQTTVCLDGTTTCWSGGVNAANSTAAAAALQPVMGHLPAFTGTAFAYSTSLSSDPQYSGWYFAITIETPGCPTIGNLIYLNGSSSTVPHTCRLGMPIAEG